MKFHLLLLIILSSPFFAMAGSVKIGDLADSRTYINGQLAGGNRSRNDVFTDVVISTHLYSRPIILSCANLTRNILTTYASKEDIATGKALSETSVSITCELKTPMQVVSGGNIFSVQVSNFELSQREVDNKQIEDFRNNDFSNLDLTVAKVVSPKGANSNQSLGGYGDLGPVKSVTFACDGFIHSVLLVADHSKLKVYYANNESWKFDGGLTLYPKSGRLRQLDRKGGWTIGSRLSNTLLWEVDYTKFFHVDGKPYNDDETVSKEICE